MHQDASEQTFRAHTLCHSAPPVNFGVRRRGSSSCWEHRLLAFCSLSRQPWSNSLMLLGCARARF